MKEEANIDRDKHSLVCVRFLNFTCEMRSFDTRAHPVIFLRFLLFVELKNDYKEITEKLDKNLQVLHSAKLAPRSSSAKPADGEGDSVVSFGASASATNADPNAMDVEMTVPFALVDEIVDAEDGLQLGDQIVKFGNVENGDNLLQKLASEAQTNQGCAIPVMVQRQGAQVNLMVTPRTWQGRGLLGCIL